MDPFGISRLGVDELLVRVWGEVLLLALGICVQGCFLRGEFEILKFPACQSLSGSGSLISSSQV